MEIIKTAVVILTRCKGDLIRGCLASISEKTRTPHRIIIGYTGDDTCQMEALSEYAMSVNRNSEVVNIGKYNFAKNNNALVGSLPPEIENICFCNDDVLLIDDCIDYGIGVLTGENGSSVGTIGFKLLYENGNIQHAGQSLFVNRTGKFVGVSHVGLYQKDSNIPILRVIGNTAALMMIKRSVFESVGGFNEKYRECFEDVELSLRCIVSGLTNVCFNNKSARHLESQTRCVSEDKREVLMEDSKTLADYVNMNSVDIIANKSTVFQVEIDR